MFSQNKIKIFTSWINSVNQLCCWICSRPGGCSSSYKLANWKWKCLFSLLTLDYLFDILIKITCRLCAIRFRPITLMVSESFQIAENIDDGIDCGCGSCLCNMQGWRSWFFPFRSPLQAFSSSRNTLNIMFLSNNNFLWQFPILNGFIYICAVSFKFPIVTTILISLNCFA